MQKLIDQLNANSTTIAYIKLKDDVVFYLNENQTLRSICHTLRAVERDRTYGKDWNEAATKMIATIKTFAAEKDND